MILVVVVVVVLSHWKPTVPIYRITMFELIYIYCIHIQHTQQSTHFAWACAWVPAGLPACFLNSVLAVTMVPVVGLSD